MLYYSYPTLAFVLVSFLKNRIKNPLSMVGTSECCEGDISSRKVGNISGLPEATHDT